MKNSNKSVGGDMQLYKIDGLKWHLYKTTSSNLEPIPICIKCNLPLDSDDFNNNYGAICPYCGEKYKIKCGDYYNEQELVTKVIRSQKYKNCKFIDIDGALTPIMKTKDKNDKFFCAANIQDSKNGPQLVIYAGEKGSTEKCQIFINPKDRRLSFDQKDLNPADVFIKVVATFRDGTKHIVEK